MNISESKYLTPKEKKKFSESSTKLVQEHHVGEYYLFFLEEFSNEPRPRYQICMRHVNNSFVHPNKWSGIITLRDLTEMDEIVRAFLLSHGAFYSVQQTKKRHNAMKNLYMIRQDGHAITEERPGFFPWGFIVVTPINGSK